MTLIVSVDVALFLSLWANSYFCCEDNSSMMWNLHRLEGIYVQNLLAVTS